MRKKNAGFGTQSLILHQVNSLRSPQSAVSSLNRPPFPRILFLHNQHRRSVLLRNICHKTRTPASVQKKAVVNMSFSMLISVVSALLSDTWLQSPRSLNFHPLATPNADEPHPALLDNHFPALLILGILLVGRTRPIAKSLWPRLTRLPAQDSIPHHRE